MTRVIPASSQELVRCLIERMRGLLSCGPIESRFRDRLLSRKNKSFTKGTGRCHNDRAETGPALLDQKLADGRCYSFSLSAGCRRRD